MTKTETYRKIEEITQKIVKEYQPEKIILFGSYAWGKPDEGSDVDLFIITKSRLRRIDRARQVYRIIYGSGIPIDVIVYTPKEVKRRLQLEDFFIEDIVEKGKILYSA